MSNENFFKQLAKKLKERENPTDLKPSIIGKVVQLNPIVVQIESERILLTQGDELILSEWFVFRCNIDKTKGLSELVPEKLQNANNVREIHSYTGTECNMPGAINYLSQAIEIITNEILNLKCDIQTWDYVTIASLDETDKYVLIDNS